MIHKTTRSILSVLLAVLLLVTSIPLTPAFAGDGGAVSLQSASGEGRALEQVDGVYQIGSAEDLRAFAELVNGGKTDADAVLTDDINLSDQRWTPIGSDNRPYTGTFNGAGHTISGLYIDSSDNDQGLFGYVSGSGKVQNLSVSGSVKGDDYVGGVVGDNRGSVEDCDFTGSVSGNSYVGGVVGVVGDSSGSVKNCYNTGAVSSLDSGSGNSVGGVVGYNGNGIVTNCYNTGSVSGKISVGGVVGHNEGGGNVTDCYFLQQEAEISGIGNDGSAAGAAVVSDLTNQNEFKGWDFDNTWRISTDKKHPVLQANAEDNALSGTGTQEDPYKIYRAIDLKTFRDLVNDEGEKSAHAKLMNNINLSSVCGAELSNGTSWEPIGNSISSRYSGTFDGDGHTISGLYIDFNADYQGLFGYVGTGGTVKDLTVSGSVKGGEDVGGVVGYNRGRVENCHNTGSVKGSGHVGGVVGSNSLSATVTNCYNTGAVSGGEYVGGVVGQNFGGTVENCYNTDSVSGDRYVGGIVGYNGTGATVSNCYNTGTGTVTGTVDFVGGVVGQNFGGVKNCYNTVTVSGSDHVGGVVGDNFGGTVENCYNTGTVSDGTTSGGVVGENFGSGSVTNCYFLPTADVNKNLSGIGLGGEGQEAIQKTADEFRSGEVACLLQGTQTTPVWGQSALGTEDSLPTLVALDKDAKPVYKVAFISDNTEIEAQYANSGMTVGSPTTNPTKEGYTFAGWFTKSSGGSQWNFSTAVTKNMTLYAQWTAVEDPDPEPEEPPYTGKYSYEIATDIGDNGALSVDRYATEGDKVTIDVTPDQAYKLDDLVVTANGKDVELTANSDGTYTFTMPSADVRITATFAEDPDWTPDEPEEPTTDVSDLFIDIAPNAWYKDAIQYAYDNGLMTGVSATEFAPEQTTTRAMIVSILARLEGVESAEAAGFADVTDEWYATAVNWAANVGVVNGYEDGTFKPNTAITREQLAAILMNYAAYKGEDVSNRADLTSYTDQPSTWAQEAMQWAVAEGLISGVTADTLQPQGAATRAQVAAILQRFLSE